VTPLRAGLRLFLAALVAGPLAFGPAGVHARDVPYVPTPWAVVEAMLALGKVGAGDFLVDLGSGDGRIVITAAKKHGARGFGVDLDGDLVQVANAEAKRQGVAERAVFQQSNIFETDFSQATVVTLYLLPDVNLRLRDKVLALRPGTRVVSHDFSMGDWRPDVERRIAVPDKSYGPPSSQLYLWIVPAQVQGRWSWRIPVTGGEQVVELELVQRYQDLSGTVTVGGRSALLVNPRIEGDRISFGVVDDYMPRHEFGGRVTKDAIEGNVRVAESTVQRRWVAARNRRTR
jgi:SAM-dependent methyltransferase